MDDLLFNAPGDVGNDTPPPTPVETDPYAGWSPGDNSPIIPIETDPYAGWSPGDNSTTVDTSAGPGTGGTGGTDWLTTIGKGLGLLKSDGTLDLTKLLAMGAGGAAFYSALTNQQAYKPKTAAELLAMQPSNTPAAFSADQMAAWSKPMLAGNQIARVAATPATLPTVPGKKYAEGGEVEGPLTQTAPFVGAVPGGSGGQTDLIDAKLSGGEYVFDAETVAMLGDGDNAAGAQRLDELRQQLRQQKRSAPDDEISEPAQGPLSYLQGAAQ